MKPTAKLQREIHNHQKRHGCSYEKARDAVRRGYGTAKAERDAVYAERRRYTFDRDQVSNLIGFPFLIDNPSPVAGSRSFLEMVRMVSKP